MLLISIQIRWPLSSSMHCLHVYMIRGSRHRRRWRVWRHFLLGASLWKTYDLLRLRFGVGSCVAWLGNYFEAQSSFLCCLFIFVFFLASLRGLESERSVVIVGRICPLMHVEAGFIILNLKEVTCSLGVLGNDWHLHRHTIPDASQIWSTFANVLSYAYTYRRHMRMLMQF
jgi:hypothetical protein